MTPHDSRTYSWSHKLRNRPSSIIRPHSFTRWHHRSVRYWRSKDATAIEPQKDARYCSSSSSNSSRSRSILNRKRLQPLCMCHSRFDTALVFNDMTMRHTATNSWILVYNCDIPRVQSSWRLLFFFPTPRTRKYAARSRPSRKLDEFSPKRLTLP